MKKIKKEVLARALPALLVVCPALGDLVSSQEIVTARNWFGLESDAAFLLAVTQVVGGGMLFFRKLAAIGALFCAFVLGGAIPAHLFDLGFQGEMGVLFTVSMVGFLISTWIAFSLRKEVPVVGRFF